MCPPTLGNFLPEDFRTGFVERNFNPGAVVKFFCSRANKEKRFIYVGDNYNQTKVALVYINTEINVNVFPTAELQNEHLPLEATGRDYLEWKSYVDCSDLMIYDRESVKSKIEHDLDVHLGHLSPTDFQAVVNKISISKKLSPAKKRQFGFL